MPRINAALLDMRGLDFLATCDSPVHRRDPRAKVVATLAFIVTVVSFQKYTLAGLMPLLLYPVALIAVAGVPLRHILGKLLLASPFALLVGLFNPVMDQSVVAELGPWQITGGWVSFASILLRFVLTVSAALILVATTGFIPVCLALERMCVPRAIVVQLMLLYRYVFVLAEEASRMSRAWSLRSVGGRRMNLRDFGSVAGHLLIRAIDRAHRIHMAMLSRGFDGEIRLQRRLRFGLWDAAFAGVWMAFFAVARFVPVSEMLGKAAMGPFS